MQLSVEENIGDLPVDANTSELCTTSDQDVDMHPGKYHRLCAASTFPYQLTKVFAYIPFFPDVSEHRMSDTTTGKTQKLESEKGKNITPNVNEVTQTQAEVAATPTNSVDTRTSRRLKKQRIDDPSPKTENKAASTEQKRKRKRKQYTL